MTKILFILLIPIFALGQNEELAQILKKINPQGFTGFELYDPNKQETLFQYNENQYFIPASNAKIYTLAVTYPQLGDSIASAYFKISHDTLYLKPLGDPTFFDKRFSSLQFLKLLKIQKFNVLALDLDFDESSYAPGWSWDDFDQVYMPERSIFPFYKNLYHDDLQEIFQPDADLSSRDFHENNFGSQHQEVPFIVSNSLIIQFLQTKIHKKIIEKSYPFSVSESLKLYSNSKNQVYKEMMLNSDNFLAEQLWINTANTKFTSISKLKENYDSTFHLEIKQVDGSGLSRYDLMKPKDLIFLLTQIQNTIPLYQKFFPENGVSGTLENSFLTEKSYIIAKTGSMSGVYNLSGYIITNSGKTLIFSLMNNNFTEKWGNLKDRTEELLLYIKKHY